MDNFWNMNYEQQKEHIKNLVLASFIGLFIIVIVVLIVISEGDGLDGLDASSGSASHKKTKTNPYDFSQNLETFD